MQSAFLGVLMALFGNGLIGLSFSVMKVAHQQNRGGGSYLRIPLWWAGNAHPRTLEEPLGCSQTNFVHICQKSSSREIPQPSWERAPPPLTLPCPQGAGCESSTPGTVHIRCSAANSPLHPPDFGLDRPNFAWVRKETLGGHAAKTPESAQGPTLGSGVNFG